MDIRSHPCRKEGALRAVLAVLLSAALAFSVFASLGCSQSASGYSAESLAGTWQGKADKKEMVFTYHRTNTYELFEDGTFVERQEKDGRQLGLYHKEDDYHGTWRVSGKNVTLHYSDGSDDDLVFEVGGNGTVLTADDIVLKKIS